jgi:hypothetical protein
VDPNRVNKILVVEGSTENAKKTIYIGFTMRKLSSEEKTRKLQAWVKETTLEKFFSAAKTYHFERNPGLFLGLVIEDWLANRSRSQSKLESELQRSGFEIRDLGEGQLRGSSEHGSEASQAAGETDAPSRPGSRKHRQK